MHVRIDEYKGGVHCGVTMETLPDRVTVLPAENYPNPIPEENATRLSPSFYYSLSLKLVTTVLLCFDGKKEKDNMLRVMTNCPPT